MNFSLQNKNMIKKILIFFMLVLFSFSIINYYSVFADDEVVVGKEVVDDFMNNPDVKIDMDGEKSPIKTATTVISAIIFIMQVALSGFALIMLIVIGIKFIGGSVQEKAEIKKHLVMYVLGATLLFGATGLVQVLKTFFISVISYDNIENMEETN